MLALNIGNMALRDDVCEHRDEVPYKYSRPVQGKPPYWSVEGLFVMNGNLPDSHLRAAKQQGLRSRLSLHVLRRDDRL
jgi:hypothetical protein